MPSSDTQFKPGDEWKGNAGGRPKGQGLKQYDREKFAAMTDEEKEQFLTTIPSEIRYRMAEGNPHQESDVTSAGKSIVVDDETKAKIDILLKQLIHGTPTGIDSSFGAQ